MKTNHQRGFVDGGSFCDRSCTTYVSRIAGVRSIQIGNDFTNGHRGHARAVRDAKSFIRSRERRDE